VAIAVITLLHYFTHSDLPSADFHTIFRRLYYLPIAALAVVHGLRVGAASGVIVGLLYAPHAFLGGSHQLLGFHLHQDPSPTAEKVSEVILYVALGVLVGVATDRSRALRAQRDAARSELERSERLSALGRLVAGVAHEVRNPLASLLVTAEMFLDDYAEGDPKHRMAELNLAEVKRLEEVVSRFLAFASPRPPAREATDMKGLLSRVQQLAQSTAKEHEVQVVLGDTGEEQPVLDADQILQVLLNLVLNAIDASPKGGAVRLGVHCDPKECRVDVLDDGEGVPVELRERVFEPFFTTRAEGTGLGLSLANQIVEAHDGWLSYADRPEGGAHFSVHLPRQAKAAAAARST